MSAGGASVDTPAGAYVRVDWVNPLQGTRAGTNNQALTMLPTVHAPRLSAVTLRQTRANGASTPNAAVVEPALVAQGIDVPSGGSRFMRGTFGTRSKSGRPKNGMRSTGSALIARVSTNGELRTNLNPRLDTTITFMSIGKTFLWYANTYNAMKEPLARVLFASAPVCHDVNQQTASQDAIDVLLGFDSGDILWIDAVALRYNRINKGGTVTSSAVSQIRWLPGSETQFITSHADGSMRIWDRDSEEAQAPVPPADVPNMPIVRPTDRSRNPMSIWRISDHRVTDFAFSPDTQQLAIVADDGILRIVDMATERCVLADRLLQSFKSYFGALLCVCWSPDGRIVATGGQDDLVTFWEPREHRLIARAQGHSSFVTNVVADPWRWNSDTYRFMSVGEDANMCIWDFSPAVVQRPARDAWARRSSSMPAPIMRNGVYEAPARALVPLLQPSAVIPAGGQRLTDMRIGESGFQLLHCDSQLDLYTKPNAHAVSPVQRSFSKRASTFLG